MILDVGYWMLDTGYWIPPAVVGVSPTTGRFNFQILDAVLFKKMIPNNDFK
jgi:hypothetical protein